MTVPAEPLPYDTDIASAAALIADFLGKTYRMVPAGQETDYVNVEAELTDLLRQAS